jgi:hypothetical protein
MMIRVYLTKEKDLPKEERAYLQPMVKNISKKS